MKCNDNECYFCEKGECCKVGKCLKEVDNNKTIQATIKSYWQNLRDKYNNKK